MTQQDADDVRVRSGGGDMQRRAPGVRRAHVGAFVQQQHRQLAVPCGTDDTVNSSTSYALQLGNRNATRARRRYARTVVRGPVERGLAVGVRRTRAGAALQEVGRRRGVAERCRQDQRRLAVGGEDVDGEAEVLDQVAADVRPAVRRGQVQRPAAAGGPDACGARARAAPRRRVQLRRHP